MTDITGRTFRDANALVYAYNRAEPVKRSRAQELLTDGQSYHRIVVVSPF